MAVRVPAAQASVERAERKLMAPRLRQMEAELLDLFHSS
jgi:hypothetical protein